jgi:hypothetical protein
MLPALWQHSLEAPDRGVPVGAAKAMAYSFQVFEETSGELVYALRIHGTRFRPPVFKEGTYTIKVEAGDRMRVLGGVRSVGPTASETLELTF